MPDEVDKILNKLIVSFSVLLSEGLTRGWSAAVDRPFFYLHHLFTYITFLLAPMAKGLKRCFLEEGRVNKFKAGNAEHSIDLYCPL